MPSPDDLNAQKSEDRERAMNRWESVGKEHPDDPEFEHELSDTFPHGLKPLEALQSTGPTVSTKHDMQPSARSSVQSSVQSDEPNHSDHHVEKGYLEAFIDSNYYDVLISAVILFNAFCICHETNIRALEEEVPRWLNTADIVLVCVYCVDIAMRLLVLGKSFFSQNACLFDFTIVCIDIITNILGLFSINIGVSFDLLRIFRLAKLFRLMLMLSYFEELQIMLKLMLSAARTIFWGVLLMFVFLTMWSIIAVSVLHPLNRHIAETTTSYDGCDRCERAFQSVQQSILTFFQTIIAGDSWGQVSVVLIEHYPWTFPILFLVVISMQLWLLNLVITVMVDQAQLSRECDVDEKIRKKQEAYAVAEASFVKMCQLLDTDKSGNVSLSELTAGYECSEDWAQTLASLDLGKDDIAFLFALMDEDDSGTVSYKEFAHYLHEIRTQDTAQAVAYTKALVTRFQKDFRQYKENTYQAFSSLMKEARMMKEARTKDLASKDPGREAFEAMLEAPEEPEARGPQPEPAHVSYGRMGSAWGQHRADLMADVDTIMEEVWHCTEAEPAEGAVRGVESRRSPRRVGARSRSEAAAESACAPAEQAAPARLAPALLSAAEAGSGVAVRAAGLPTGGAPREDDGRLFAPA